MALYFNADTQVRSFAGLQNIDDGSGVTLQPGEKVDVDGDVGDRWLQPCDPQQSADGVRKVQVVYGVLTPEKTGVEAPVLAVEAATADLVPAPAEPAPEVPDPLAAAEAEVEQAAADLAAAKAAEPDPTPTAPPTTPTQGA